MNRASKITIYSLVFLVAFGFFALISFPYEFLKENIATMISRESGVEVSIGRMAPVLPLGIKFEDVKLARPGGKSAVLKVIQVKASLLRLLIGSVGANLLVGSGKNGEIAVFSSLGIGDILSGSFVPSSLEVKVADFPIGDITAFAFDHLAHMPGANPLLAPELKKLILRGDLNSLIQLSLNAKDPIQSQGTLSVKLKNSSFAMDDGYIEEQTFKTAQVDAVMSRGKLDFAKGSGFQAQDIGIGFSGDVALKNPMLRSLLNLRIPIRMEGGIKEKFGILLEMQFLAGERLTSELVLQVTGPLERPAIQPAGT
jgi:type II secretion system protein N